MTPAWTPRHRAAQATLFILAAAAAAYARTTLNPLQEVIRKVLGLSDNWVALLQGPALALPFLVAAIPIGLAVDRYSRVRLLIGLSILELLGSLLTAVASDLRVLFFARCIVGLAALAINPVVISLLADLYAPVQRGRATMALVIGQVAGQSAAFALGGRLLSLYAENPSNWRAVMGWLAGPLFLVFAVLMMTREPARTEREVQASSVSGSFRELWGYRMAVLPALLGIICAEISVFAAFTWSAPALARAFQLPSDRMGDLLGLALLLGGILGPITGGLVADRCHARGGPPRTLMALCILSLLTLPSCLYAVVPDITGAIAMLIAFLTMATAACVVGTTLFTVVVPNELRGLSISLLTAANVFFGIGAAPLAVSALSGFLGGPTMIGWSLTLVCTVAGASAATAFAMGSRILQKGAVVQRSASVI